MLKWAPYLLSTIPLCNKTVALNEILEIDPSSSFRDDNGSSLTIKDATYSFNGVISPIPGSFFSIVS